MWISSIMHGIPTEVPCIYGIGSHSYFLFVDCQCCFSLMHLHMNSVVYLLLLNVVGFVILIFWLFDLSRRD